MSNHKVTYRPELVENNIELSVRHLKQFFKFGHGPNALKTKAVHDVSFDIKKGECFGLVGESGCGKTTTGRSLIRLYDITSGSIYFKGYRISAGKRWNEKEIKWSRIKGKNRIRESYINEKNELMYASVTKETANKLRELSTKEEELKTQLSMLRSDYFEDVRVAKSEYTLEEKKNALRDLKTNYLKSKVALSRELASVSKEKTATLAKANTEEEKSKLSAEEIAKKHEEIKAKYAKEREEIKAHVLEVKKTQKETIKKINYDNRHVDKKLMSKMQMIFQDPVDSLDPRMTVEDIIQEGLHIQGQHNKYANSRKVAKVLEKVGLIPEYASRYPHEFSGGQRQRIGIARALIMNPDFLICDEPISALDVSIRAQIINLLNDLKEEMGLTILFIAHDLSVVKYFCDRIAVMYFGEIVELADSDELFKHPLHPYTDALLSAIPKPDPLSEKVRQRHVYNPMTEHDYSKEKPTLQEIVPGHFVLANSEEMVKYRAKIKQLDKNQA
jgi:ABC-type oligopeptide transport system ATPase subunit